MPNSHSSRIHLVISACLLGKPVRYDGGHRFSALLNRYLSEEFQVTELCPEVMAGLSVPRPPVQLIKQGEIVRALGLEDRQLDVTDSLVNASTRFFQGLTDEVHGFIFKSRSPSCGLGTTPIYDLQGMEISKGNGVFANAVQQYGHGIPLTDDACLDTADKIQDFLNQVRAFYLTQSNSITSE